MATSTIVLTICLVLAVLIDIFLIVRISVLRKMLNFFDGKLKEIEKRLLAKPNNGVAYESENGTNPETRGPAQG